MAIDVSQFTGTWNIDPSHTTVGFTVRHLMISKVRGRFTTFAGTIEVGTDLADTKVTAEVDLASIDTDDENRDGHLRSADFFEVEAHPKMTFVSTSILDKGDRYVMVGDLSIRGVTKSVELDVEFEGTTADPWGNTRIGFSATGEINRKDWGIEWNAALETGGVVVGDKVKLELDVEAVKA